MIQLIRGFRDILPGDVELWQEIESVARRIFEDFGFREIRIPIMEKTELFARSIGEHTDIVEKEMYSFPDRRGDMLTLRPEATAAVVRSYIQHKMYASDPVRKLYTIGPMFRRDRPQKGRYRQFYQLNVEIFGVEAPFADAQLIYMLKIFLDALKISDVSAHVNSLGCPKCRPDFRSALLDYIDARTSVLCEDCLRRKDQNPLRVLDCKVPACRDAMTDAPSLIDHLCADCKAHFDTVRRSLDALNTPYAVDKRLVRGLDYYTRTAFEMLTGSLGAQSAVAGGGRYDGLIKHLGGPDTPAIGFAIGFDRLAELVGLNAETYQKTPDIFIAALGSICQEEAFQWICQLNTVGVTAEIDMADRSLKSQMKRADKLNARYVLIYGEEERNAESAILRNMANKEQVTIGTSDIVDSVRAHVAS